MTAKARVIFLMGPTASGKTDLAIDIARARGCELISVDSALVYRGLDIGSAKPDYPHHLIDIRDPGDVYSAADFCEDARAAIGDILSRGRTPLLVGGTMLYFKALLEGLSAMPAADPEIRAAIEADAQRHGWPHIHRRLEAVDPQAAARIHPNHSQRLSRALEVYLASGTSMSGWQNQPRPGALGERFEVLQLAICPAQRAELHRRIALRFELMMRAGFEAEVQTLRQRGDLHANLPAIRAVGYRQLWQYLDGEYSLEEALQRAVAATRQLAKRQLTWLRKWPELCWVYTNAAGMAGPQALDTVQFSTKPLALALNYLDRATM